MLKKNCKFFWFLDRFKQSFQPFRRYWSLFNSNLFGSYYKELTKLVVSFSNFLWIFTYDFSNQFNISDESVFVTSHRCVFRIYIYIFIESCHETCFPFYPLKDFFTLAPTKWSNSKFSNEKIGENKIFRVSNLLTE